MQYGLSSNTVSKINEVLEQFPVVEKAVIYGSRAKGNFKASSDIDITLKGSGIDLSILIRLNLKLDDLLLPYKFDLSIYNHIANPELLDHIDRVGQTLWDANKIGV
ncbi:nucleotidyltransferase domain-containing protein [Mucilaginibacter sp.]|uniref:nucleotidyltransferase domain-containing protein n=1 Tax=Mucilaginibacter sp. TaxID=1882438 RepID=UPI00261A6EE8|nr:nucleotidyltransferase domain-containing protein [Mucilaginibacter sp.]MDB4926932.1 polymerase beta domain protein region [Mucilaginibacter sp.]